MPLWFSVIPVFFPLAAGLVLLLCPAIKERYIHLFTFIVSLLNLGAVLALMIGGCRGSYMLFSFTDKFYIAFSVDTLGSIFSVLVSVLWPFSLIYGYEYMEFEKRKQSFFAFYIMTLGSVVGIAFAGDMFTMYIFYEILTLVTFPLVMHTQTKEALKVGKQYLCYMLGGAAFAFMGLVFIASYSDSLDFRYGGILSGVSSENRSLLLVIFIIMFFGFSVKAAMMPFGKWLIKAAIAPTPVTALLHAVAVVKAGAFAIIRLIYYTFGTELLIGTWAQYTCIVFAAATILYGSCMSVKEPHLKRRLAYSTISNLSYIILGASLMTPMGLTGSVTHLIAHAVTKIGMFFCIGSIMHVTGKNYVSEIDGLGRKMKWIFGCYTVLSLSLIGIPQFIGFVSKFKLLEAAIDADTVLSYAGAFVILISALLTAVYLLNVTIRAYFPVGGRLCENYESCKDPGFLMLTPIVLSTVASLLLGIFWEPLVNIVSSISAGSFIP